MTCNKQNPHTKAKMLTVQMWVTNTRIIKNNIILFCAILINKKFYKYNLKK